MLRYYRICDEPEKLTDEELGVKIGHLERIREMELATKNYDLSSFLSED